MKNMKKLIAIVMTLLMVFTLVACSSGGNKVADYIAAHEDELLSGFNSSFEGASGMTVESSVEAEGNGMVITVKINELDNVPEEIKTQIATAYEALSPTFETALDDLQKELPELEFYQVKICEKDGDVLATISAGK